MTGSSVYQDPKWASPFTAGGALELLVLPVSALRVASGAAGSPGTLTLRGQVAPNLDYRVEASPSLGLTEAWQTIATLRSDASGLIEYPVATAAGRMYYRLVFDVPAS